MTKNWDTLLAHPAATGTTRIVDLFTADTQRATRFSASLGEMLFDYSKTAIDDTALAGLIALAEDAGVATYRDRMFAGEAINETEGRAVLHTALRNLDGVIRVDGTDVMPEVRAIYDRMAEFAEDVRAGRFAGAGGKITDVVNIGIGGSDLGPAMAALALKPWSDGPRLHFVSNVDGAQIAETLADLNPATTLVIVASKTFTTIETMTNAQTAKNWMAKGVTDPATQFAAVSTSAEKTAAFGIAPGRVFGFEDWVGGRYSMWGPIGLALMIGVGADVFRQVLDGGAAMDRHFCDAPLADNLPVMLALVGIWHHQICGYPSRAVLPYDQRLARLPAYLQQLEMESNGKSVCMDGTDSVRVTGPIVWGEPGTNGQHAFYQLIHQGTGIVPCEFLVAAKGHEPDLAHHHHLLVGNCLAQAEALLLGRSLDTAREMMAGEFAGDELERQARHRVFPGNRPSTMLIYPQLTPFVFGQIIALYEHRVFVEGVILGINSYDQWGVELGKELAKALGPVLAGDVGTEGKDGSTARLVEFVRTHQ